MQYWILALVLDLIIIITSGCGYHLHSTSTLLPTEIETMTLSSYDPYGSLTRAIRMKLRLNNVRLIDDIKNKNNTLPSLRIVNSSKNQVTSSVFQNSKAAEHHMILSVHAQVLMPGKNYYPIDINIYRSFFNSRMMMMTLAKEAEEDIIWQEMYQQAAQCLVQKLMTLHTIEKTNNALNTKSK